MHQFCLSTREMENYDYPLTIVSSSNGQLGQVRSPVCPIGKIFHTLEGSAFCNCIDMSAGFHKVPIEESLQDYTAFSTPCLLVNWVLVPMVLTGSPTTFRCLVVTVTLCLTLENGVGDHDVIIIISSAPDRQVRRMRFLFECFRNYNLKINPNKRDFNRMNVQFFGHIDSIDSRKVDPSKNAAA